MLSHEKILQKMDTEKLGQNVIYLDETDSTNEYVKKIAPDSPEGTLVVADCQKSGKGRLGRNWSSPHGEAVFMSFLLKEHLIPENASMITIVAAIAVQKALSSLAADVKIKWPNDIVLNGRKVCGILTEMKSSGLESQYVVVGIGINVNNQSFPENIARTAASLYTETRKKYDRSDIICNVMKEFEKYYHLFVEKNDLSGLMSEYNQCLVNRENEVEIIGKSETYRGKSLGIDSYGRLLVQRCDTGMTESIVSGEVSVRGVYGYV